MRLDSGGGSVGRCHFSILVIRHRLVSECHGHVAEPFLLSSTFADLVRLAARLVSEAVAKVSTAPASGGDHCGGRGGPTYVHVHVRTNAV